MAHSNQKHIEQCDVCGCCSDGHIGEVYTCRNCGFEQTQHMENSQSSIVKHLWRLIDELQERVRKLECPND